MFKFCSILFFLVLLISCLFAQEEVDEGSNNQKCVHKFQCFTNGFMVSALSMPKKIRPNGYMDDCPCKKQYTCCKFPPEPKNEPTQHFHCGEQVNIVGTRRESNQDANLIVAKNSEFPWTLAVFKKESEDLKFICGASLIGQRVAVTANHNVADNLEYLIRAGSLTLHLEDDPFLIPQDRNVDKVIRHSKYRTDGLLYDIALLIWDKPLEIESHINAICLPDLNENFDDLECKVSGWGASIASTTGKISERLKFHNLPIVSNDECSKLLRKTRLGKRYKVHRTHLCAGSLVGKDTYKGDGASPLVCLKDNERYYKLAGLVSWVIQCGLPLPGIYVHIANLVTWMRTEMENNGVGEFISSEVF